MGSTLSFAARQVRRRHRITVIRATGAPQNRSSTDSRECAGSGQPLPSPWIAPLRVPVTARLGRPPGSAASARRPACTTPPATRPCSPFRELALVRAGRNLARGRLDEAGAHQAVAETHVETAPPDRQLRLRGSGRPVLGERGELELVCGGAR